MRERLTDRQTDRQSHSKEVDQEEKGRAARHYN